MKTAAAQKQTDRLISRQDGIITCSGIALVLTVLPKLTLAYRHPLCTLYCFASMVSNESACTVIDLRNGQC
jgi:hypothetical protein